MGFKHVLLLFLTSLSAIFPQDYANITVTVDLSDTVAETDDNFVCATIDWWPPEKCNYNDCPWGMTSVLNLDLNNPYLSKAIQAFNPLRIRVGGTLQNRIVYDVGSSKASCSPFMVTSVGLFGFSTGCLSMERWDEVNSLFLKTGQVLQTQ
ncbi:hypothetical protein HPP92_016929 [Vanilla planifolia]|uniref:Uncharacterized protein n=1 Tax=Vanilla planifolia TaxID=51239 RepID=A0A835QPN6_VANPL|nr:hypothetical protein HPP92_016929 [Vanilla planifolia]